MKMKNPNLLGIFVFLFLFYTVAHFRPVASSSSLDAIKWF